MDDDFEAKQQLFMEEIVFQNYDESAFLEFCLSKKKDGDNFNNWSLAELKNLVKEFVLIQKEKNEKKVPDELKSSRQIFNDYEKIGDLKANSYSGEKIKLEFSLEISKAVPQQNLKSVFYSIQAKLYDNQVFEFNSEEKEIKSLNNNITIFDNFFMCDFYFEKKQNLEVTLNIKNKRTKKNQSYDIKTTLGCIVGAKTFKHECNENETLLIKAEKMEKTDDLLSINFDLKLSGELTEVKYFVNNKIYYDISSNNKVLFVSNLINNNGIFDPCYIPTCLIQSYYTINFYNSKKQVIGRYNKKLTDIKSNNYQQQPEISIPITNDRYIDIYDNSCITKNYTFIDYIKAGVKIALSIAIDFTGSNGHPLDPGSLHECKDKQLNDYEKAIFSCGNIVAFYDYDQLFPVYGFGAVINSKKYSEASMCFNLNFSDNPDIHTIEGVLNTYRDCIKKEKLTFSGPTEFTPLIKQVISTMKKGDLFEYHILMILTDGVINDLKETIDILVEASL